MLDARLVGAVWSSPTATTPVLHDPRRTSTPAHTTTVTNL
jgi:hypothetical protein